MVQICPSTTVSTSGSLMRVAGASTSGEISRSVTPPTAGSSRFLSLTSYGIADVTPAACLATLRPAARPWLWGNRDFAARHRRRAGRRHAWRGQLDGGIGGRRRQDAADQRAERGVPDEDGRVSVALPFEDPDAAQHRRWFGAYDERILSLTNFASTGAKVSGCRTFLFSSVAAADASEPLGRALDRRPDLDLFRAGLVCLGCGVHLDACDERALPGEEREDEVLRKGPAPSQP